MTIPLLTIDTEGDNFWDNSSRSVSVNNLTNLPLLEKYIKISELKIIFFCSAECFKSKHFMRFMEKNLRYPNVSVGLHPHPCGFSDIFDKKASYNSLTRSQTQEVIFHNYRTIEKHLGIKPTSHRAPRWTLNADAIQAISTLEIESDHSITPGINWSTTDPLLTNYRVEERLIKDTLRRHNVCFRTYKPVVAWPVKALIKWVMGRRHVSQYRPTELSSRARITFVQKTQTPTEVMIHSSELSIGTNPYNRTESQLEKYLIALDLQVRGLMND